MSAEKPKNCRGERFFLKNGAKGEVKGTGTQTGAQHLIFVKSEGSFAVHFE